MKRLLFAACLSLPFMLINCMKPSLNDEETNDPYKDVIIRGSYTNVHSNEPIQGIKVTLSKVRQGMYGPSNDEIASAVTDSSGAYFIKISTHDYTTTYNVDFGLENIRITDPAWKTWFPSQRNIYPEIPDVNFTAKHTSLVEQKITLKPYSFLVIALKNSGTTGQAELEEIVVSNKNGKLIAFKDSVPNEGFSYPLKDLQDQKLYYKFDTGKTTDMLEVKIRRKGQAMLTLEKQNVTLDPAKVSSLNFEF